MALHRGPFLAGGDAVPVAFEDHFCDPADDSRVVLVAIELCDKLLLELLDL